MADGSLSLSGLVSTTTTQKPVQFERCFERLGRGRVVGRITRRDQREKRVRRTRKTIITGARLAVEQSRQGGFRGRWAMLTLTYRQDERWVASQLGVLMTHVRKYAKRRGFPMLYVWALELTEKGRPHYHVLIWLPKGRTLPKPDKQGWWRHGSTRIEWARRAVGYLAKYASKGIEDDQWKLIPKGARMCGNGGLAAEQRIELRWWKLPTWVRDHWPEISDVLRVRGGYVKRPDGEFLASPFRVAFVGGVLIVMEKS